MRVQFRYTRVIYIYNITGQSDYEPIARQHPCACVPLSRQTSACVKIRNKPTPPPEKST